jgi:hypothetical protein
VRNRQLDAWAGNRRSRCGVEGGLGGAWPRGPMRAGTSGLASGQLECHQLDQLLQPRASAAIMPIPGSPGAATRTTAALAGATAVLACAAGHGRTRHASKGRKTTDPPEALEKRMQRSAGERWASEHAAAAGLYMGWRRCPLTVLGWGHGSRFAPGGLRCDLERLYPKVSGTARRCSLAMGTPGARRGLAMLSCGAAGTADHCS